MKKIQFLSILVYFRVFLKISIPVNRYPKFIVRRGEPRVRLFLCPCVPPISFSPVLVLAPFLTVRSYARLERYRQIIAAMIDISRHCKEHKNIRFALDAMIGISWYYKEQANTRFAPTPTLCVVRLRLNGDYLHPIPNLGGYLQYILEYLLILFYF